MSGTKVADVAAKALEYSMAVDLDAQKAARAEANREAIKVTFDGQEYTVPAELPYSVLRKVQRNDLDGALTDLLGQDQADRLLDNPALTLQDVNALLEGIVSASGGGSLGEA